MTDQLANAAPARADIPRIYVACLAAYNLGCLHGRWIDVTTPDEIMDEVRAMLADSPVPGADEWAIHDYEGFKGASLSEFATFEAICELADFIEKHGKLGGKVLNYFHDNFEQARAAFEDYAGKYRSAADFAENLHKDAGTEIPEPLRYYIDWQAIARDMALCGDIMVIQMGFDEVHIFWSL